MKSLSHILVIAFLIFSCTGKQGKTAETLSRILDTLIVEEHTLIRFEGDSIYSFYKNSKNRKVIYTHHIPTNHIHYKIFNPENILIEIAFVKDIPLAFDSFDYGGEMYPRLDSVVQFYNDGKVFKTGYVEYSSEKDFMYAIRPIWEEYWQYDTLGNMNYHILPTVPGGWYHIGEIFYMNGQIKERWEQGEAYISGALMNMMEWDSLGNKYREHTYEHLFPEWGTSYNDRFSIETIIEYYPNGKVKMISKNKSFVESFPCRCGRWEYFAEDGKRIRTEQYHPCNNFELEESNIEEY